MEIVLLVGGLGTRFTFYDGPKCLAPVMGKPFINYILNAFNKHKFILSIGYDSKKIKKYLKDYKDITFIQDNKMTGTYNAVFSCLKTIKSENFIVMNGDTLFTINLNNFYKRHLYFDKNVSIAAKEMIYDIGNYVRLNLKWSTYRKNNKSFLNSGIYCFNKNFFDKEKKGNLEDYISDFNVEVYNDIFIDIGNNEEYKKLSYLNLER